MTDITHHYSRKKYFTLFVPGLLLSAAVAGLALVYGSLQETRQALQEVQQGVQLDTPMQDAPPPSTPPPPATRQGHDGT